MRHKDLWNGIDALAKRYDLTPSALARLAGLDPTAFNKSKRTSADGERPRWPSTESLSRVLNAVGASWDEFSALAEGRPAGLGRTVPLIGLAQAGDGGFFDDSGFPVGEGWEQVRFPGIADEPLYALEINGDSMEPAYRDGDRIIVAPAVEVRRGDRVVAKTTDGEILAKILGRLTDTRIELVSINRDYPDRKFERKDIDWVARILWVSQ